MGTENRGLDVEIGITLGRLTRQLTKAEARFHRTTAQMEQKFQRSNEKVMKSFTKVDQTSSNVFRNMARGAAVVTSALGVREIQRYADAWTSAENQIRAAEQISGMAARTNSELNELAAESRSGFTEMANLYARLLRVSKDVSASEEQVALATMISAKAFKAGGAAASEQAAGVMQLSQALSSGFLQGDELRSLRENAPLIAQAIAKEFETTIGGLKALGAAGELTSDRVFEAILNGQADIEAAFSQTRATIRDSFTLLGNALTEYIGAADRTLDVTGKLATALAFVADNLNLVAIGAVVLTARGVTPLAVSLAAKLAPAAATAATALQLLTIKGGATLVTMNALKASMAVLGGPFGIAVLAASAAAYAFTTMKSDAEELRDATSNLGAGLGEIANVTSDLEKDYRALEKANRDLADAHLVGGQAAQDAATLEISAVNRRISANEKLRQEMMIIRQAELNDAKAALEASLAIFDERFTRRASFEAKMAAARSAAEADGRRLRVAERDAIIAEVAAMDMSEQAVRSAQQAYRDLLQQKVQNREELSSQELSWLALSTQISTSEQDVAEMEAKLEELGQTAVLAAGGVDATANSVANLANQATGATSAIATLVSMIPDLNAASQVTTKLVAATAAYEEGMRSASSEFERFAVAELFEKAKAEIDGTADATRDATSALEGYLDQSYLGSLDARSRAVEVETKRFAKLEQQLLSTGAAENDLAAARAAHAQNLASIKDSFSSGGGGGENALPDSNNSEIENLQFQISLIGKSANEIAALTFRYEALQKSKREGLALDQMIIGTGVTLREQIDLEAEAISNLTLKSEQYRAQADFMANAQQSLKDGFIDAILEGENFGGTLENLGKQIARAALQASLFGEGPLAALFGSSPGTGGGSLLGLVGGLFGFAEGGFTGQGGKHEPKGVVHGGEYVFSKKATKKIGVRTLDKMHDTLKGYSSGGLVSGGSSIILPTHAMASPGRSSPTELLVTVFVDDDGTLGAIARQEGALTALPISVAVVKENNRRSNLARKRL